ncbi:LCP family protein [Paenibacillus sp. UNC217MF]|uniref:LCP family protein n=2 Tax=Paenibacillus TaxID=44249 RepID=A0ABT4E9V5_PAEAL|nr:MULTISPECIES: LCP family protein [unclassified Paenibacillus]MCY9530410.1 LCP family protein [Paenibacillus alvei]SDF72433.1 cell envelope-related function transcriptional attenuator common domain-containing protein [Paenibacillus sp. cl6col]
MKIKKKWIVISLSFVFVLTVGYVLRKELALLTFDMFLSNQVEKKLEETYKPITIKDPLVHDEPFSVLLLGIDQRDKEVGRSDSMIYSIVRRKENRILLISVPRDSYTEIVGKNKQDKIAHAYAFGGAKMSIDSVEQLLEHPVTHYAAINFTGFKNVVDALGGIKLPITEDIVNKNWNHDKFRIEANKPIYNGLEALNFVRYREDSDMNRMMRNRIFLQAVAERAVQLDKFSHIPEILDIAGDHFSTDIAPTDLIDLAKSIFMKESIPQFSTYALDGEGMMMHDIWYYKLDEKDLAYARELISNWLDPAITAEQLMEPKSKH